MTKDEALRLALEAMEGADEIDCDMRDAITAIKAALEAKDEPVATKNNDGVTLHLGWDDLPVGTKLYTTPPQRTWVEIADEDYIKALELCDFDKDAAFEFFETKLKEKNG
jgi:hypothetical protein